MQLDFKPWNTKDRASLVATQGAWKLQFPSAKADSFFQALQMIHDQDPHSDADLKSMTILQRPTPNGDLYCFIARRIGIWTIGFFSLDKLTKVFIEDFINRKNVYEQHNAYHGDLDNFYRTIKNAVWGNYDQTICDTYTFDDDENMLGMVKDIFLDDPINVFDERMLRQVRESGLALAVYNIILVIGGTQTRVNEDVPF